MSLSSHAYNAKQMVRSGMLVNKNEQFDQQMDLDKAKIAELARQADLNASTDIQKAKIANPATGLNSENRMERIAALSDMASGKGVVSGGTTLGARNTDGTANAWGFDKSTGTMGYTASNFDSAKSDAAMYQKGLPSAGAVSDAGSQLKPLGMQSSLMDDAFKPVPSMAGGGVIDGPEGDDQVAAEFSDGRPARLEDGEVVLPREFVHQLGVKQLRKAVEAVTGKPMDPTVKEPLPGQGGRGVLSADNGLSYSAPNEDWRRMTKANAVAAPIPDPSKARPGWEEAKIRYASPTSGGNVVAGPAQVERVAPLTKQAEVSMSQLRVPLENSRGAPAAPRNSEVAETKGMFAEKINQYGKPFVENMEGFQQAPTAGTKAHYLLKQANDVASLPFKVAGDVVRGAGDTAYNFGKEVATGVPTEKPSETQTRSGAPSSEASRIAQAMQGMKQSAPRSEQELLNKLAGEGRELSRDGNVFKYKDLSEKRPGYSGVTFSDTIEGAGLGQKTPPAADAQTMEELRGLYKSKGAEQRRAFEAQGLPGQQAELSAPAVTRGERGQNLQMRNALTARDEMMQARAAAVKPADVIAAEKLAYDRQSDAAKIEREDLAGRVKTDSPPLGLSPAAYKSMLVEAKKAGYDLDDADSWLYSVMDPDLEKALSAGKDIPDPKTGELRSPYEVLRQQLLASLGKSQ